MKKAKEMAFVVHSEEDMELMTRILFKNKKPYYIMVQRYDALNVAYYFVTNVMKTSDIQTVLQQYHTAGGYEEPIVKFR